MLHFNLTNENNHNLNCIDVSQVEDMTYLFYKLLDKTNLNINISEWDVSKVKSMHSMFKDSKFNGDISQWNVSNVKDMNYMFCNAEFNQDISNWNVSNVKKMEGMFYLSQFTKSLRNWNVSNVTNLEPSKSTVTTLFSLICFKLIVLVTTLPTLLTAALT